MVVLTAALMFSTACSDVGKTTQPDADRFELKQDARGRIVRLDRLTGEITEVTSAQARSGKRHKNPIRNAATEKSTDRVDRVDPSPAANAPEASLCNQAEHSRPKTITVSTTKAPLYIEPRVLPASLTELPTGSEAPVVQVEGDWYLVRFEDTRWGPRVGYVHWTQLQLGTSSHAPLVSTSSTASVPSAPPQSEPVADDVHKPTEPPKSASTKAPEKIKSETIAGYVEWMHDDHLIADGQRVRWDAGTRTRIGRVRSVNAIPLGYEVKVKGFRNTEGAVVAEEIEAKPNGAALFEADVIAASNTTENQWLREGQMFEPQPDGRRTAVGRVVDSGERVQRVRRIMRRLVPSYVDPNALRVRVVENGEWNAFAMGNGAIWVFSGLIDATTDDELAIVLGHELAHYTHEHSRRKTKRNMLGQLVATVADEALASINSETVRQTAGQAAALSLSAWTTGYSRETEDQADRVGLRYAYEAGYNVSVGPSLWARVRDKVRRDGQGQLILLRNTLQTLRSHSQSRAGVSAELCEAIERSAEGVCQCESRSHGASGVRRSDSGARSARAWVARWRGAIVGHCLPVRFLSVTPGDPRGGPCPQNHLYLGRIGGGDDGRGGGEVAR